MKKKPLNEISTTLNVTNTPQPMAEVLGKLHPDLRAKTRIMPKVSKEEMEAAIFKANNKLGKCGGHTTRY